TEGNKTGVLTELLYRMSSVDHEIAYMPSHWSKRFSAEELFPYYFKFCEDITKDARNSYKHELNISYGASDRTKYDIYGTDLPKDAPILVFIHGGYWMEFSKDLSGFVVPNFVSKGIKVIVAGYDLCPNVTLTEIVQQAKTLAEKILVMAKSLGSKGVWICGHSAGAHLAASLIHDQNWLDVITRHKCRDLFKGLVLIGGVYALEPLLRVSVNESLKLTPNEISTLSFAPLQEGDDGNKKLESVQKVKVIVTVGECDSPIFIEESRRYARRLTKMVDNVEFILMRNNTDHFDIVENLVKGDFLLSRVMVDNIWNGF
ncbi:hypothetical protein QAD02_004064, partial [Eretmocerus hayati]